ncbi:helix-turn-helix domain-containing protein [Pontibacter sp. E15-1]|uniref:helix-turn-helix domain-containing protein n=1 Tax=Pontibacter sp. E15-1 TaxID=2919918 RepID=UPI001F4F594A|nr:helix-turn-helix domain-containing protein [Pontibacter sp. E15-1]MCJ8167561.1 helix-turn-helix domain-containing protein [Pontibacter sp. E15-1]
MRKPDRHNEIEINYFSEGSITYLFQENKITIPAKRLALFWGLVPHQIVTYEGSKPYVVCTIPFSQFLEWKLPPLFVDRILKGEILLEACPESSLYDEFLLKNWIKDINNTGSEEVTLLEMHARLIRMANNVIPKQRSDHASIHTHEISQVEKIAIYIAQNYCNPIKVSDIGKAVGLHADYANAIFKKSFGSTLSEYITEERISHAQRKLVATDKSITEIAFACGFNSISRFNAAFLRINSCTPREFRKRYQWG